MRPTFLKSRFFKNSDTAIESFGMESISLSDRNQRKAKAEK